MFTIDWATSSLPEFVIPIFVIASAVVVSMEIWGLHYASRWIVLIGLVSMWCLFVSDELQIGSIIFAIIYHAIQDINIKWKRGISRGHPSRKRLSWMRFWTQVFAWASAFSVVEGAFEVIDRIDILPLWVPGSSKSLTAYLGTSDSENFGDINIGIVTLLVAILSVYQETQGFLVMTYFSDQTVMYSWRQRCILWGFGSCFAIFYVSSVFKITTQYVLHYVSPALLVGILLTTMCLSIGFSSARSTKSKSQHTKLSIITSELQPPRPSPKTPRPTPIRVTGMHPMRTRSRSIRSPIGVQAA